MHDREPCVLSTDAALKNLGGNEVFYAKLLQRFVEDYADFSGQMAEALAAGDPQRALRLAHSVKGVAANLGAFRLAAAAGELENALAARTDHAVMLTRMHDVLRQTLAGIRNRLAAANPESPPVWREMNAEQRAALVALLRELPDRIRTDWLSLQEPLKQHESLLAHPATAVAYSALLRAVDDFDADAARIQAEAILAVVRQMRS